MNYNPEFWFILGFVFVVLEVVLGLTIVLFFCGLSAFTMGFLLYFNITSFENLFTQFSAFIVTTFFWAAILWRPMKRYKDSKLNGKKFENYVGQPVIVTSKPLKKGGVGTGSWSGTTVKISIHEDYPEKKMEIDHVGTVVEVRDNIFIIK
jgi:membrane protein implicated in regulation of membrane protease activity